MSSYKRRFKSVRSFLALGALGLFVASPRTASAFRSGSGLTINQIGTGQVSVAWIWIPSGVTGTAPVGCSGQPNIFGINVATEKGRALFATATAAMAAGKKVSVTGAETCTGGTGFLYQEIATLTLSP